MGTETLRYLCLLLLGATTSVAAGSLDPVVDGNTVSANAELGAFEVEIAIEFEQAVGLSADNLGLSAELVDPTDTSLLSRFTDSMSISPATGLPVLVKIQPPANGGLSFSGVAAIELYTHDLQYTVGTPLRLFSAPDGGTFQDITTSMSSGSYRVRGSKGTFSEFLIVADLRSTAAVVDSKFSSLSSLLYTHSGAIGSGTFTSLENDLNQAQAAWNNGDPVAAIAAVEAFSDTIESASGSDIPDVWRSARDIDNVAGLLRASAATLRHSLTLASNQL